MEFSLSGNALKTFARSITCLARIGNDLVFQCSPSQVPAVFFFLLLSQFSNWFWASLNQRLSYRIPDAGQMHAHNCPVFLPFDNIGIEFLPSHPQFVKAICSVLRTPIASIDHLSGLLPDSDASKLQWTLDCFNGMKKSYWITCNVEPDIQHLSLDRRKLPSSFVVRPRDFNRLLANFQSSLQEITIIATQSSVVPPDAVDQIGGKSVELRSYIDPTKENDTSLHTQLWIDPAEEFVHYSHTRDPVDITFGVKELKAFLSYCEGCEVDVHLYFDKAGEPILMAPKFGMDNNSSGNFDATLVLATMLVSQLNVGNPSEPPLAATDEAPAQHGTKGNTLEHPSDHTRIWSELSGSAAKDGNGVDRQVPEERNCNNNEPSTVQRISAMNISKDANADVMPDCRDCLPMETDNAAQPQDADASVQAVSQRHPSNWVDADEDDDEGDEADLCVQSTPPYS
ncbi:cell cycle checkpoint control family protein [Striga asiatica]|uniref:Cell cycle checkpoint control family protein n=1 Tax=Striga asiatica TaxID=4170 RepID=A0A5A7PJA2_STRAF|nr:cell cycle checkpoint control family protein [Striga asiatica]